MKRSMRIIVVVATVALALGGSTPASAVGTEQDGGTAVSSGAPVGSVGDANGRNDPWMTITANPVGVSRPAGAFVNGHFLVIGGEESGGARNGYVQEYDPVAGTWDNTNTTMPVPMSNICAAAIGNDVYVPGGYDGAYRTELQVYHQDLDTWETIATDPSPYGPSGNACVGFDNKVYMFGGNTGSGYTDAAYVYDPAAAAGSRWTALAVAPMAAGYGDALAVEGGIFYTGFRDAVGDRAEVYRYDPVADTWATYPSLTTARAGARLWRHEGYLAVGGGGWGSYLTSVEQYDLSAGIGGTWAAGAALNTGRRTFAAAQDVVNGYLYAGAGWAGTFLANAERSAYIVPVELMSLSIE